MNILIFAHDCGLRGAERVVADQAEALIGRGWTVYVMVPCKHGGLTELLQARGVNCVHVKYYSWIGPGTFKGRAFRILMNLIAIPRLLLIIRSLKPDIVHVHSIACGVGAIVARLSNTPRIWQVHESGPYGRSSDRAFFDLGERLSHRLVRWTNCCIYGVSSEIANLYNKKLGVAGIGVLIQAVVLNQIDAEADAPALARLHSWLGRKLVIVGSLLPLKDQITAVRAMPRILRDWPDTKLFLIGDDPLDMSVEIAGIARDLGIQDKIVEIGKLANAAPAIRCADCCLITSLDEGFGRVTIEAMLCETAVIAANVGVNREVAGDGNADFFEPSDPESLAAAVSELFMRPQAEQRNQLARALSYARHKFSTEAATDALEAELLACLKLSTKENTRNEKNTSD